VKDIEKMKKVQKDFENVSHQYDSMGKTYKNVESGEYAEGRGFKLQEKGILSTGEKFKYIKKNNNFVVTDLDKNKKTYSYDKFLEKYGATDMTTIITPEGYKPGDVMSQKDFDELYNRSNNESASINKGRKDEKILVPALAEFTGMTNGRQFVSNYGNVYEKKGTTYVQVIYADKEPV